MILKSGEPSVACVAADANVLLSAIIGKAALRVFTRAQVEVATTLSILEEVREYLPRTAKSYDLVPELLEVQQRLLGIKTYPLETYRGYLSAASRRIGRRDPDDVELLALALALKIPVWSNDSDFASAGIAWYTTAELLKVLEITS